jgi:Spy/CpxP family protein refolding chaperone
VKIWKVIFATLVIFAAGAFSGGWWVKSNTPPATQAKAPVSPFIPQQHFQERLKRELKLTADQTNRIDKIFAESNGRRKILVDLIDPELRKERQEVHESIRAILTPEQRETFERLLKEPPRRPDGQRRGPRSGTNWTNNARITLTNSDARVE